MVFKPAIMAVLVTLSFILSLFLTHYNGWQYAPALLFLLIAFFMGLWRNDFYFRPSSTTMCIVLLCCLMASSFLLSTIPFSSQIAFCIFCTLPLAFFTAGGTASLQKPLAIGVGFVLGGLSLWALIQTLWVGNGLYGARAMGPLADPNILATILGAGLVAYTGITLASGEKHRKFVLTLLCLVIFSGLIATMSRGGLIATLIGICPLLFTTKISLKRLLPALSTAAATALIIPAIAGTSLWSGFIHLIHSNGTSITDRLSLWRASWKMFMDHPWIGSGPGSFGFYYPAYREPMGDQSLGYFAHLDPLQMGVENGILGPVLFYALLVAVLYRTIAAIRSTHAGSDLRLRIITPFMALLVIAIQAHINFPLYTMPVLMICGILLAFLHRATDEALNDTYILKPGTRIQKITTNTGLVLCGIALMALSISAAGGNYFLQKSRSLSDPKSSLVALAWAERIGPDSFIGPEIEMARINLDLIHQTGQIKSAHLKNTLLQETQRLLAAASAWNPAWSEIDDLKGQMYQSMGQKGPMLESWFTALEKNPMDFSVRKALATELTAGNRTPDAIKVVTGGLNYPHPLSYREWSSQFLRTNSQP